MNTRNNLLGSSILCLAALIWGLAFVAQSQAADRVPPLLFNALRSFIAAIFLFCMLAVKTLRADDPILPKTKEKQKKTLVGGILCGTLLAVSVNLQQFGLTFYPNGAASEARAGFLTSLYVILVPIISTFLGKRLRVQVIAGVAIAFVGIYLLSFSGGIDHVYFADLLVFLCAISFSFHILSVDRYGEDVGGIRLSMVQFAVCGVLSLILSLIFEKVVLENILSATPQILYLGIFSSGIGYTLQIYGQRFAEPTVASLSMSLEGVFAALGGWLISGNALTPTEIIGCSLVFFATVLSQLERKRKKT